ncbi:hypothetical protein O9992_06250 [Vibrio lentus]|nr:hypothetical protein [Vibrio lentus]
MSELKSDSVDIYTVSTDPPFALARFQEKEAVTGVECYQYSRTQSY